MDKPLLSAREVLLAVEKKGIEKAKNPNIALFLLGILAGAYIAFGCFVYLKIIVGGGSPLFAASMFLVGLILVIFTGAELFTGNNIMVYARLNKKVKTTDILRNWVVVYFGNLVGSLLILFLVWGAGMLNGPEIANVIDSVATNKTRPEIWQLFIKGILCNIFVVLAVWISFAPKDTIGKVVLMWFPITAFVIAGFEHSVANMFFLPAAMITGELGIADVVRNIIPVTLGNIVGGALFVPITFYFTLKACEKSESKEK